MADKDLVSSKVLQELVNKLQDIINNYCWNLEYFTPTEVEGFFDGTQQEIDYYSSLIKDDVVSKNFLHSSKQIADDIAQSILEANEYTDSLLKNISSIKLEYVTELPTSDISESTIYILKSTDDTSNDTLNLYNTTNGWTEIGDFTIDLTNYIDRTTYDTDMALKANKTEVVANDKIVQALDSATNSSDTVLSTNGLRTELNKLVENLTTINEDIEWAEFTLMENTPMVDKDYVPFTLSRGNINIDNGLFTLKANKIYFVTLITRGNDINNVDETIQQFYSVALMDIKSQTKYIITFHDVQHEEFHRAEVPSSSTVIKPSEDITLGAQVTNLFGDYNSLVAKQTKIVVVEIPSPTSIINVTEDYIKEIQEQQITTIIDSNSTNKQIPNALAVYDSCIKDNNIKTYTEISQLGLSHPCTTGDVFNALPTGSCLNIFASLTFITDLPAQQGLLSITKASNKAGFEIIFKRSSNGSITENFMWIGQLKGVDGTGLTWKRICATKVADVDKTLITTQNLSTGIISYYIKNGLCYVSVSSITPNSDGGLNIGATSSLPNPDTRGNNHHVVGTTSGVTGLFIINTDGSITFYGKKTLSYFGQFSYPVAEN